MVIRPGLGPFPIKRLTNSNGVDSQTEQNAVATPVKTFPDMLLQIHNQKLSITLESTSYLYLYLDFLAIDVRKTVFSIRKR